MIYPYLCDSCKETTEVEMPMMEDHPASIKCKCGKKAHRVFGQSIHIPDDFKAVSDISNGDHGANLDYISGRMRHSHPSGRTSKIYY